MNQKEVQKLKENIRKVLEQERLDSLFGSIEQAKETVEKFANGEKKNIDTLLHEGEKLVEELLQVKQELESVEESVCMESKMQKLANKFETKSMERVTTKKTSQK